MASANIGVREDLIKRACSMAMKAHKSPNQPFLVKNHSSSDVVFSFPGSWSFNGWCNHIPFGEIKMDRKFFPSLISIANDDVAKGKDGVAKVNKAFLNRFQAISTSLQKEVEAVSERKHIVFTGHSSGGPIAILATIWFLENYPNRMAPHCLTFGSPLVGDSIFNHALGRENWSQFFIHFVMRYDIVPRILLAPFIEQELQQILNFLNQKSTVPDQSVFGNCINVMRNASSVANHAACSLMGNTNLLLETLSSFIELSPYRPFGTYVFYTGNDHNLVVIKNPDTVLQVLFYSTQLNSETESEEVAMKSLMEHMDYQTKLPHSLDINNVTYLDHLEGLPLSTDDNQNMALNDLGLSTRARLCVRAAGEAEIKKDRIDAREAEIEKGIRELECYKKTRFEVLKVGYYDAFKISEAVNDFEANVKRLELAGIWDEIIEKLKSYELPDGFEGRNEWVKLGTRYQRLVEPLDIANYYRHSKNEDAGPYMKKGRPGRYRYIQRLREHALGMTAGSSLESCFWAQVEELRRGTVEKDRNEILALESNVEKWYHGGELGEEVFLEESTFVKWWKTLPDQHKSGSCISGLVYRERKNSTTTTVFNK